MGYYITISTDKHGRGATRSRGSNLSHRGLNCTKGNSNASQSRRGVGWGSRGERGWGFRARLLDRYLYKFSFNPSGAYLPHLKVGLPHKDMERVKFVILDHLGLESYLSIYITTGKQAMPRAICDKGSEFGAKPEFPLILSPQPLSLSERGLRSPPIHYLHRHFLPATQNRANNFSPPY